MPRSPCACAAPRLGAGYPQHHSVPLPGLPKRGFLCSLRKSTPSLYVLVPTDEGLFGKASDPQAGAPARSAPLVVSNIRKVLFPHHPREQGPLLTLVAARGCPANHAVRPMRVASHHICIFPLQSFVRPRPGASACYLLILPAQRLTRLPILPRFREFPVIITFTKGQP